MLPQYSQKSIRIIKDVDRILPQYSQDTPRIIQKYCQNFVRLLPEYSQQNPKNHSPNSKPQSPNVTEESLAPKCPAPVCRAACSISPEGLGSGERHSKYGCVLFVPLPGMPPINQGYPPSHGGMSSGILRSPEVVPHPREAVCV